MARRAAQPHRRDSSSDPSAKETSVGARDAPHSHSESPRSSAADSCDVSAAGSHSNAVRPPAIANATTTLSGPPPNRDSVVGADCSTADVSACENAATMDAASPDDTAMDVAEPHVDQRRLRRDPINYPPEILALILRQAYLQSRRHFRNYALVNRQWAHCTLPILYERISPRISFPLPFTIRSITRLHRTLTNAQHCFMHYSSFTRSIVVQLYLKNSERLNDTLNDSFMNTVDTLANLLSLFPKLDEIGITVRIDSVTIPLQATVSAFLERLATRVKSPTKSMWIKLAGVSVLDSQCVALADAFGPVMTDFHLTKCMSCTANGLRYFLQKTPKLQSLALYVPSIHGQLLGTIASYNLSLMDLWLDLPMEEGTVRAPLDVLKNFCTDLQRLLMDLTKLRRLRLRGIPLNEDDSQKALEIISSYGSDLQSLSVLVWPPVSFGQNIERVCFTNLSKLIISSNSRISKDFIMAVANGCPSLSVLDAGRTAIDDECLIAFATNCPKIENIDISRCAFPTLDSMVAVAKNLRSMNFLDLSYTPCILRSENIGPLLYLALFCKKLQEVNIDYPDQPIDMPENAPPLHVDILFSEFGALKLVGTDHRKVLQMTAMRKSFLEFCLSEGSPIQRRLPKEYATALSNYTYVDIDDNIRGAVSEWIIHISSVMS